LSASAGTCVFAYGTLKSPDQLDAVLGGVATWSIAGEASVAGTLYDTGAYPALRLDGGGVVPGILLRVAPCDAALARLDEYEGVPEGLFVRKRLTLEIRAAVDREVWVYEYNRSVADLTRIDSWPVVERR
jgi:gamma-glutamylcyclotransferase (GGCT)/AIG2-like uncharacterized protein YtfP